MTTETRREINKTKVISLKKSLRSACDNLMAESNTENIATFRKHYTEFMFDYDPNSRDNFTLEANLELMKLDAILKQFRCRVGIDSYCAYTHI